MSQAASSKRFLRSFSSFELGGISNHLMTGPEGNSEFCYPLTSMLPSASPRETLPEGLGETKLTVSLVASH